MQLRLFLHLFYNPYYFYNYFWHCFVFETGPAFSLHPSRSPLRNGSFLIKWRWLRAPAGNTPNMVCFHSRPRMFLNFDEGNAVERERKKRKKKKKRCFSSFELARNFLTFIWRLGFKTGTWTRRLSWARRQTSFIRVSNKSFHLFIYIWVCFFFV